MKKDMATEDQREELEALRSIFENEFTGKHYNYTIISKLSLGSLTTTSVPCDF